MQFVLNNFSIIQHTQVLGVNTYPIYVCTNMILNVVVSSVSNKYSKHHHKFVTLPPLRAVVYPDVAALSVSIYNNF